MACRICGEVSAFLRSSADLPDFSRVWVWRIRHEVGRPFVIFLWALAAICRRSSHFPVDGVVLFWLRDFLRLLLQAGAKLPTCASPSGLHSLREEGRELRHHRLAASCVAELCQKRREQREVCVYRSSTSKTGQDMFLS